MKEVKHYPQEQSFPFHQNVVERKKQGHTKSEAKKMEQTIQNAFKQYNENFDNDRLPQLQPIKITHEQKTALQSLYAYKMKPFKELKQYLTTDKNGRMSVLCPNCTIETIGTFDHLLPQSEFPEYSDNPLNLIVCCSTCNSKKNDLWRKNGERLFLNLYLDKMPDVQYLFASIDLSTGTPVVTYTVENKNSIGGSLFTKIKNHYDKLELCKRFKEASDDIVNELEDSIVAMKDKLQPQDIKDTIIKKAQEQQKRFGYNYWKSIFQIECCRDNQMFNYLAHSIG